MKVLISGGSRGIGAACVRRFAASGWDVTLIYAASGAAAAQLCAETGATAIQADVADPAAVRAAVNGETFDALICCAGIASYGLFQDLGDDDWQRLLNVNIGGVRSCVNAVLPGMLASQQGSIVTIGSIWGEVGASCEAAYSATKGAVHALTQALSKELGPSGIRVNCVSPGVIQTDMIAHFSDEDLQAMAEETSLGRIGQPEDVANAVYFLCSKDAGYITGQILSVGGGFGT